MVSHHSVKFSSHKHCDDSTSGDTILLVVEGQDSTYSR